MLTTVVLGQVTPGPSLQDNLAAIDALAQQAAEQGASALLLPEFATFLHGRRAQMLEAAEQHTQVQAHVQALARRCGLWILLGSLVVPASEGRMRNRSLLIAADGSLVTHYDKLHLFDVTLPDGSAIFESRAYDAGSEAVLADTPWGVLGLSICYDLRFPHLYRALAGAGAQLLVVPSAFARATGRDHWLPLLTARAIESGAYVLAPATCGSSPGGRDSHGHTVAIDPWGRVLGSLGDSPGALAVRLDLNEVALARSRLPCLQHDRPFALRRAGAAEPTPLTWSPPRHGAV